MKRNIAIFTGTRAEYGLLYWLMKDIVNDTDLNLQLFVSGSHLSPEFGLTYKQIEDDGFQIDERIEMLLSSDSPVGVIKSMGLAMIGIADVLSRHRPDVCVVLGDRFEALAAAQSAMLMKIPVAHIHGGEITEGAYDDAIRHAITKLSLLHFTATDIYRKRVIQLGESPERVFNVGAVGLEYLNRSKLMTLSELEKSLDFRLNSHFLILTYHPVTLLDEDPISSFCSILNALDFFPDVKVIITYPNSDDGGRKIIPLLENYANKNSDRVKSIHSLGQIRYLSSLQFAKAVIGNSSSGIIEAPSFHVPTVNIGVRQKGRLAADSVIHCPPRTESIVSVIHEIFSNKKIFSFENPYGCGNSSQKIIDVLKVYPLENNKKFHDLLEM